MTYSLLLEFLFLFFFLVSWAFPSCVCTPACELGWENKQEPLTFLWDVSDVLGCDSTRAVTHTDGAATPLPVKPSHQRQLCMAFSDLLAMILFYQWHKKEMALLLLSFIWIIAVSEGLESGFFFGFCIFFFLLLMTMELLEVWIFYFTCLLKRRCDAVRSSLTFSFVNSYHKSVNSSLNSSRFLFWKKTEVKIGAWIMQGH